MQKVVLKFVNKLIYEISEIMVLYGHKEVASMANSLKVYHCPICGKRVFDATIDSVFHIEIKCPRCGKIVEIDSTPQPHHQALALLPINNELRKCG